MVNDTMSTFRSKGARAMVKPRDDPLGDSYQYYFLGVPYYRCNS